MDVVLYDLIYITYSVLYVCVLEVIYIYIYIYHSRYFYVYYFRYFKEKYCKYLYVDRMVECLVVNVTFQNGMLE